MTIDSKDSYDYFFTNDLRINDLRNALQLVAQAIIDGTKGDKTLQNISGSHGFYFGLTETSNCAKACYHGVVDMVILNCIKKFQYPNAWTVESYKYAIADGIRFAPLRTTFQLLHYMSLRFQGGKQGYLRAKEIEDFLFFNDYVAKNPDFDLEELTQQIMRYRNTGVLPESVARPENRHWHKGKIERQLPEMLSILKWSDCVDVEERKDRNDLYRLKSHLTSDRQKANAFEITNYHEFWEPAATVNVASKNELREDYLSYFDLKDTEMPQQTYIPMDFHASSRLSRNLIYFGAPGTGKSFLMDQEAEREFSGGIVSRVTFHPDYTYAQFIGGFRPYSKRSKDGNDEISYRYVAGPFMEAYVHALQNPTVPVALLIEEINRANPAAVFGDIFQLLDRKSDNTSTYTLEASEELSDYLRAKGLADEIPEGERVVLSLPQNLFLWATMNSADQGVFPMDTAFKRRWDFRYIGIDESEGGIADIPVTIGDPPMRVNWNSLRKTINGLLVQAKVNEDKLIGPYFIKPEILIDQERFPKAFKDKVLMYLYDDAAKLHRSRVFNNGEALTYSQLCENFDRDGIGIFKDTRGIVILDDGGQEDTDGAPEEES